jgi:hypothetical protein
MEERSEAAWMAALATERTHHTQRMQVLKSAAATGALAPSICS